MSLQAALCSSSLALDLSLMQSPRQYLPYLYVERGPTAERYFNLELDWWVRVAAAFALGAILFNVSFGGTERVEYVHGGRAKSSSVAYIELR